MSEFPVEIVSANYLARRKVRSPEIAIVDVRLQEEHAAGRIPGSVSNCVFEVGFLERMEKFVPNRRHPVCVYGESEESRESRAAAEKLIRAGYSEVLEFRGGMSGWKAADKGVEMNRDVELEGARAGGLRLLPAGSWVLDTGESSLEWTGRSLLKKHRGNIAIKHGEVEVSDDGHVLEGEVVLNMREITCQDLAGDPLHDVLIHHLESDDFFDVERFPEGRFEICRSQLLSGATPGSQNIKLGGGLELRGIAHEVEFSCASGVTPSGLPAAQAVFSIDRTRWNIFYGSGRFFQR